MTAQEGGTVAGTRDGSTHGHAPGRVFIRALLAMLLGAAVAAFVALGATRYLSLDALHAHEHALEAWGGQHPILFPAAYFLLYGAAAALSLPGGAVLTLVAGALFGLAEGTVLVSFASTLGAALAFLASRFVLREPVQRRFGAHLSGINQGIAREGAVYLLSLRLIPAVPFVLVNLLSGLTPLPLRMFYWVSQLGMLPATIVYVNAGTRLGEVRSLEGVLSPELLGSFALLAAMPLVARAAVGWIRARRQNSQSPAAPGRSDPLP